MDSKNPIESLLFACFYRPQNDLWIKQAGATMLVWKPKENGYWELAWIIPDIKGNLIRYTTMIIHVADVAVPKDIYVFESQYLSSSDGPHRYMGTNQDCITVPNWEVLVTLD
jgi:hypothetical protein